MAEISLRAYVKEIEDLVENDQIDEAIAHARHLLQSYPKHLDTYRLLGKAYLEAKRYGDSADIFQRVLSSVPDDFISHIGMSIVREDEGNLDDAIWHMERAFETNPSNPAIQKELRRLIGKRDGVEPHKVRLTRGALARMYAHGELYPQGIAELQAALREDPNRPDLEVLLSRMHWRLDQRVEAAEVASRILENLPFCLEANRILAAVLQADARPKEATLYLRRYASLEPYAAFLEAAMDDPAGLDEDSIRLDKLEWRPGQPLPEASQPQWAASLGLELGEGDEQEATPAWLQSLESESAGAEQGETPESPEPQSFEAEEAEAVDIPDWMREAGWGDTEGEAEEESLSFTDQELEDLESGQEAAPGIEPAEIPDWLKGIAPSETSEPPSAAPFEAFDDSETLPSWLTEIAEEAAGDAAAGGAAADELADEIDSGFDIPPWLEEAKPGATESIATWLGEKAREELEAEAALKSILETEAAEPLEVEEPAGEPGPPAPIVEEPEYELEPPEAVEAAPSWLSEVAKAAAQEKEPSEDSLARLREQAQREAPPESKEPVSLPVSEAPDWIQEITEPALMADWEPVEVSGPEMPLEPADMEETPDWLDELGPMDEDATAGEEPPDWLREFEEEAAGLEAPAVEEPEEALPIEPFEAEETVVVEEPAPEAMEAALPLGEPTIEPEGEAPVGEPEEEIDWLQRLEAERGVEFEEEPLPEGAVPSIQELEGEAPDWLTGLIWEEEVVETPEAPPEVTAAEAVVEEPAAAPTERFEPVEEPWEIAEAEEIEAALEEAPARMPEPEPEWAEEAPAEPMEEAEIPGEALEEITPVVQPQIEAEPPPTDVLPPAEKVEPPAEVEIEEGPAEPVRTVEMEAEREAPPPAVVEPVEPVPARPRSPLESAREALDTGDIDLAIEEYGNVKGKRLLKTVIEDLQDAVRRRPSTPELWQALGDALMKANRVPEAIEAYRRGLEAA